MDRHNCPPAHRSFAAQDEWSRGLLTTGTGTRFLRQSGAPTFGLPQIETCDPIANLNYRELYVHIAGAAGNITKQWSHTLASASLHAAFPPVAGANAVITS